MNAFREGNKENTATIKLAYGTFKLPLWSMQPNTINPDSSAWGHVANALKDIKAMADTAGARVVLGIYPDLFTLAKPYLTNAHMDFMENTDQTSHLTAIAQGIGYSVVDYTPSMVAAYGQERISHVPTDYHPNTRGIEIMFQALGSALKWRRP